MLDESLDNFLESLLTAEMYKLYIEVISYLESIEYSTIQDELIDFAFEPVSDDVDKTDKTESMIVDEMHAHLKACLVSQLTMAGITTAEDCTLQNLHDLCIGLLQISSFEDEASIISTCQMDESPEGKLAEILQLLTSTPADQWLMYLESVAPEVLTNIMEILSSKVDIKYHEIEGDAEYLQKIRLYSEFCQPAYSDLKIFNLIGSLILGQEFVTYVNSGVLQELFEGDEMDKLARELYGMALLSQDAKNDPVTAIRTIIEQYLEDMPRIVKLNNQVSEINAGFVKFFQIQSKGLTN